MCACASNHVDICVLLLAHHARLYATNDRGMTAVHIATFLGSLEVLRVLVNRTIDAELLVRVINQGDERNQTALFYACIEGHLDLALYLLHAGANAYHIDHDHQTCLHAMLSSSIILKRHIVLFYRLIQFVDYRFYQDRLERTLLDLAHVNRYRTISSLLRYLHYRRHTSLDEHSNATSDVRSFDRVLSLRECSILKFKRSLVYHRYRRQPRQIDLLKQALQDMLESFEIVPVHSTQSFDDLSLSNKHASSTNNGKKFLFSKHDERKLRKPITMIPINQSTMNTISSIDNVYSSVDSPSTASQRLTSMNFFKRQRTPSITWNKRSSLSEQSSLVRVRHPMTNLVQRLISHTTRLDELLDFPSLTSNRLLANDLQLSIETYNLLDNDRSSS
jgi:hypothetical protein